MNLFDRWQAGAVPSWLRAWLPSPVKVSQELLTAPRGTLGSAARALGGAGLAVCGAFYAASLATWGVGASLGASLGADGRALGSFPRGGLLGLVCNVAVSVPCAVGVLVVASLLAGAHRPQVPRLAMLSVALPAAFVALALWLPESLLMMVGGVVGAVLFALSLAASRPRPSFVHLLERATVCTLAAVSAFAMFAGVCIAGVAACATVGFSPADGALLGPAGTWVVGASMLGVAALMLAVSRAVQNPWSAPDTWLDGALGEGRVINFGNGVAPRQASEVFEAYRGPVVVIPLGGRRQGVFRGDGAPDDGWTVPGTTATLREAVASCQLAAHATVLFVTLMATALIVASSIGAMAAW